MRLFLTPRKLHPFANKGAQKLQEKAEAQLILGPPDTIACNSQRKHDAPESSPHHTGQDKQAQNCNSSCATQPDPLENMFKPHVG